jgi:hypothetical protein
MYMSIVTLSRKTAVQYKNMSVGLNAFSLNGTLRNQGYVGQTSLSRSFPRTLMRGNVARGYGGCCGKFRQMPIVQSAVTSLNNPNVVKMSVVSTMGMLENKYACCHAHPIVKPDSNQHNNAQGTYVDRLAKKTMDCVNQYNKINKKIAPVCKCANYDSFFRGVIPKYTKPESSYVPISCGEYLRQLNNACQKDDKVFQNANRNIPLGCRGA